MNQQIWKVLTATILTATIGTATSSYAQQTNAVNRDAKGNSPALQTETVPGATPLGSPQPTVGSTGVVKVGEFQSPDASATEQAEVIAKIHAYESAGRQAVTLYVRDIPILTFWGSRPAKAQTTKVGETSDGLTRTASRLQQAEDRVLKSDELEAPKSIATASDGLERENNPVWRATAVAAKLNQLYRNNVDADAIAVRWNAECNCYSIQVNSQELVQINKTTILADTTGNLAQDALQATNRLRRLMGNAPPLEEIAGIPQERKPQRSTTRVAVGPIRMEIRGMASWYGPGFHGRASASGERYNQNAMTAAHRSLPFGTNVRVTNLNNGRSVVVRINDRGPFIRGRVIDLSAAAARVLGLIHTGVAPVQVQVLGTSDRIATEN
ncbi:MAG TPA: septal ring lytic transglycosylase RlpA family protein [Coleofasciculaceae cyanobacterium]